MPNLFNSANNTNKAEPMHTVNEWKSTINYNVLVWWWYYALNLMWTWQMQTLSILAINRLPDGKFVLMVCVVIGSLWCIMADWYWQCAPVCIDHVNWCLPRRQCHTCLSLPVSFKAATHISVKKVPWNIYLTFHDWSMKRILQQ